MCVCMYVCICVHVFHKYFYCCFTFQKFWRSNRFRATVGQCCSVSLKAAPLNILLTVSQGALLLTLTRKQASSTISLLILFFKSVCFSILRILQTFNCRNISQVKWFIIDVIKLVMNMVQYSQHFIFFVTYDSAQ